jgi:hypothetical protein
MPSEAAKEAARRAWRELGFFCGRDVAAKEWRIVGSVKGLRKFAGAIRSYASNPANDRLSEYTHFGLAMNLEVGTSHPVMSGRSKALFLSHMSKHSIITQYCGLNVPSMRKRHCSNSRGPAFCL